MKKKLYSLIFAMFLIMPCIFVLSACGNPNEKKLSLDGSFKQDNILCVSLVEKAQDGSFDFDNSKTIYNCDEEGNVYNDFDNVNIEWKAANIHICLRLT